MAIRDKDLDFTVWAIINKPASVAYEAVADPDQISKYFTMGGAKGRMETGATVTLEFTDFPGPFDLEIITAEAPRQITFDWPHPTRPTKNRVTLRFEAIGETRCKVSVTETGWTATPDGIAAAYGNCMGWSQMLAAMCAWVDHGIQIRPGMYK